MNYVFYSLAGVLILAFLFVGGDFIRFSVKRARAGNTDAGGMLYVQGKKTYYRMPSGEVRKIADYPFDMTPGSEDLNAFTSIMDQARTEAHEAEKARRAEALRAIKLVAKEEAAGE